MSINLAAAAMNTMIKVSQRAWLIFALVFAVLLTAFFTTDAAQPQRRRRPSRPQIAKASPKPKINYGTFSHRTHVVTQKLACNACHKLPSKNWKEFRKGDAAFPDVSDFPEHSTCLTCHREQFFARERPAPLICSMDDPPSVQRRRADHVRRAGEELRE